MKRKPINQKKNNILILSKKLHQDKTINTNSKEIRTIRNILRRIIKLFLKNPNNLYKHWNRVITNMKMTNNMEMTNTFMIITTKMIKMIMMMILIT